MTEQEWLASKNPDNMLSWYGVLPEHKFKLFKNADNKCELLRDLVGNPFRLMILQDNKLYVRKGDHTWDIKDANWYNETVISLAHAAYEQVDQNGVLNQENLFVLSDALEEFGCDNEQLLTALRANKKYLQGFWAIDVLLGKR